MADFLIDENLPRSSATLLQQLGHDAVHVQAIGMGGMPDADIFAYAQKQQRIIISRDLGLANLADYPLGSYHGIVVLRVPEHYTASEINNLLAAFFQDVDVERLVGALTIVKPGRYRIRRP